MPNDHAFQQCIAPSCAATFGVEETWTACPKCGALLDVRYDWDRLEVPSSLTAFDTPRRATGDATAISGVWKFHALLPFAEAGACVTVGEGATQLRRADRVAEWTGLGAGDLYLQYEGLNPSGSFKDNGMAGAFTHARLVGAKRAACASTGNTSASLALFCSATQLMRAIIFIGSDKIAFGKLSQALDYGALTLQIDGDFDDAMARVRQVTEQLGIYLVNSVNPFRLEGQKTIMYRVLEGLGWEVPDWIVVPGGNLGNSSAFGKAFIELKSLGLIDRMPRIAIINAAGADTLDRLVNQHDLTWNEGHCDHARIESFYRQMDEENRRANTLASAIEINRPVNLTKCLRAIEACDGVVRTVTDQEIVDAKAEIGADGFGCEPASAASVAGTRQLVHEGVIAPGARVACVLTGHQLKDPNVTVAYHSGEPAMFAKYLAPRGVTGAGSSNRPRSVPNDTSAIVDMIRSEG